MKRILVLVCAAAVGCGSFVDVGPTSSSSSSTAGIGGSPLSSSSTMASTGGAGGVASSSSSSTTASTGGAGGAASSSSSSTTGGVTDAGPLDAGPTCADASPTTRLCNGVCVDIFTNMDNCGVCGDVCGGPTHEPGFHCTLGNCQDGCPQGMELCDNACISLDTPSHCGGCTTVCGPGQVCNDFQCAGSCDVGDTNCAGVCRSLDGSHDNCGACGHACLPSQICGSGHCM